MLTVHSLDGDYTGVVYSIEYNTYNYPAYNYFQVGVKMKLNARVSNMQ